jgi:hypothetical protein
VAGTYGLAAIRCWYVAMIDVILVSVIVPKVFCKFLLETTLKESAFRRDSIVGAKTKGLWVGLVG